MTALVDEKFKKMQDEMSRFEEEIGLPLPSSAPLPPDKPRVIGANTYHEAEQKLAAEHPACAPPLMPPLMPNISQSSHFLSQGPPPPPPAPPNLHVENGSFVPSMFGGPLSTAPLIPPRSLPGPPMPPQLQVGNLPLGQLPPPPLTIPPGPIPQLPPPMPQGQLPAPPMPPIPGGPPMIPSAPIQGPPMPPVTLSMPQRMPTLPVPPMPPGLSFPGLMGPPSLGGSFPPPMMPQHEDKVTPAVLSATPMLYVANPQLEIAAIQAEQMRSQDNQMEKKRQPSKVDKPSVTVVIEPVQSKKKEKKNRKLIRTAGGHTWEDSTLAEWDDDDFRLFCGDLGNDVTDEVLSRAFSKYSSFVKAKVIRDKRTNKTKGFGFVSFKDPQDFIRATKEMNGRYVGSRPIKLRKSTWKNRSLDVVRKKEKEKAALISMLTGR